MRRGSVGGDRKLATRKRTSCKPNFEGGLGWAMDGEDVFGGEMGRVIQDVLVNGTCYDKYG